MLSSQARSLMARKRGARRPSSLRPRSAPSWPSSPSFPPPPTGGNGSRDDGRLLVHVEHRVRELLARRDDVRLAADAREVLLHARPKLLLPAHLAGRLIGEPQEEWLDDKNCIIFTKMTILINSEAEPDVFTEWTMPML